MPATPEFRHAIVRTPGPNFADGLTTAPRRRPRYDVALRQHDRYCRALEECGLTVVRLDPDVSHPDSTFVEDTAVLTPDLAILSRPGHPSRLGEVDAIKPALCRFFDRLETIEAPGTLDAGDVCEAGDTYIIGVSGRTNEEGARQLAALLAREGFPSHLVDIRGIAGLLHLKSGVAHLGDNRLVVVDGLARHSALQGYEAVAVPPGEEYAANCVRLNARVLLAAGHPGIERTLRGLGYATIILEMSEFASMDGGLSCLSLRF